MTIDVLKARIGDQSRLSKWINVDQAMIDGFADCTRDHQWIHVDAERARRESPFGAPVAHGFLTLSLVSSLSYEIGAWPVGLGTVINYGLDKVRFLAPVRVGARIRLRATPSGIEEKAPGRFLLRQSCIVEIEGEETPALIAQTLILLLQDAP